MILTELGQSALPPLKFNIKRRVAYMQVPSLLSQQRMELHLFVMSYITEFIFSLGFIFRCSNLCILFFFLVYLQKNVTFSLTF